MGNLSTKDILVLWHKDCLDGFGAAYAAWKHLGDTADYLPMSYDMAIPNDVGGKTIYILDFSFKSKDLITLCSMATRVILIDHHEGSRKDIEYCATKCFNLDYLFNDDRSGCVLTWDYFFGTRPPALLYYIEDRALWKFRLSTTKEICLALQECYYKSFETWDSIVSELPDPLGRLYREGLILISSHKKKVTKLSSSAFPVTLQGIDGYACNADSSYSSDLGNCLAKKSGTFGLVYSYDGAKGLWKYSLRSIGTTDVSIMAKEYGGNGHERAAGFMIGRLLEELK